MNIQFHWRMLQGGEEKSGGASRSLNASLAVTGIPQLAPQIAYCKAAEDAGISALLVDIGAAKPDPILTTAAFGLASSKIGFIVAARSGLQPPTIFTQQINTLSQLIGGERVLLNIVAGHSPKEQRFYGDFLDHDQRYARTGEFLQVCRKFWRGGNPVNFHGQYYRVEGGRLNTKFCGPPGASPFAFVAGGSQPAHDLAISGGDCWMRLADTPAEVGRSAKAVLAAGKQVGVRVAVVVRPTRQQAVEAAYALVGNLDPKRGEASMEQQFVTHSDSVSMKKAYAQAEKEWLTPVLWTGAIRTHGAVAACLVGDPDQIAAAIMDYRRVGVTHFILSGWPKLEEMVFFGQEVIPRVRAIEAREYGSKLAFSAG